MLTKALRRARRPGAPFVAGRRAEVVPLKAHVRVPVAAVPHGKFLYSVLIHQAVRFAAEYRDIDSGFTGNHIFIFPFSGLAVQA